MKIGISKSILYDKLIDNATTFAQSNDIILIEENEDRIEKLLKQNSLDLALVSPLTYFNISKQGDYRIINNRCMTLENYSGKISLNFKPNLLTIDSISMNSRSDYLEKITTIILNEKYGISPIIKYDTNTSNNNFNDFDAIVSLNNENEIAIDLTEEWFELFECQMPIAFWIAKIDEIPQNYLEIIESFAENNLPKTSHIHCHYNSDEEERHGNIHWFWNESMRESLNKTADMFYYLGYIEIIPEIKLINDEIEEL